MIVRKLRLQRGWSQEQLAQLSGLSVRTIQRIERGKNPGLESLNALAAVFEVDVTDLQQETSEMPKTELTLEEQRAIEHVQDIKAFYSNLFSYLLVVPFLFVLNYLTAPSYIWAWWVAFGWGIGVVSHAVGVFEWVDLFGPNWEKKQIEKRLGRKL